MSNTRQILLFSESLFSCAYARVLKIRLDGLYFSAHYLNRLCRQHLVTANYSRTSMAQTLMDRLPQLFRTRSCVPWRKKP